MKSPRTYALILLALTTIGGAVLGWKQYQELVELRVAAMNKDERADLQKRLADLERLNRELQDQLAALRGDDNSDTMLASGGAPGDNQGGRGGNRGGRGGRGNNNFGQAQAAALRNLMAKPEVQALLSVQQKAAIDARYAALFKSLNLSPDQRAKVESLMADRMSTMQDTLAAAREQGLNDPQSIRKLMADAQNDFNNSLKSVLGDSGFAQYQNYEQTMPQRNLVNQLQQRLSYTDTPLTTAQADQLVQILAANAPPPRTNADGTPMQGRGFGRGGGGAVATTGGAAAGVATGGGGDGGGFGGGPGGFGPPGGFGGGGPGGFGGGLGAILGGGGDLGAIAGIGGGPGGGGRGGAVTAAPVTQAAVNQAQSVLSQPQVQALQQIQVQQQTQQQLQQIVRDALPAQQPAGGRGGNSTGGGGRRGGGG